MWRNIPFDAALLNHISNHCHAVSTKHRQSRPTVTHSGCVILSTTPNERQTPAAAAPAVCNVMLAKPGPRKRSPPLAQSKVTVSPFRVRCVDRGKSISQIFYSGIHHDLLVAVRISLPKVDEIQTLAACESPGRLTCMRRRKTHERTCVGPRL